MNSEFEGSLYYSTSSRIARDTQRNPVSKHKTKQVKGPTCFSDKMSFFFLEWRCEVQEYVTVVYSSSSHCQQDGSMSVR